MGIVWAVDWLLAAVGDRRICAIIFAVISGFSCYFVCLNKGGFDSTRSDFLENVSESSNFQYSIVATNVAGVALLVDLVLDWRLEESLLLSRGMLVAALCIPYCAISYAKGIPIHNTAIYVYASAYCQDILFMSGLLVYYVGLDTPRHTSPGTAVLLIAYTVVMLVRLYLRVFNDQSFVLLMDVFMGMVIVLGLSVLAVTLSTNDKLRRRDPYVGIYACCTLLNAGAKLTIYLAMNHSEHFFTIYNYISLCAALIASAVPGRIARHRATSSQTLLQVRRGFVRYISHEVRTPLNTVKGGIDYLQQMALSNDHNEPNNAMQLDTIADVTVACGQAVDILNDLLLFDKIESDNVVLSMEKIDLVELVERTLKPFRSHARQIGLKIFYINEAGPNCIGVADKGRLSQVIRNLLSNGVKFSPANGVLIIRLREVDGHILHSGKSKFGRRSSKNIGSLPPTTHNNSRTQMKQQVSRCLRLEVRDFGPGLTRDQQRLLFRTMIQFDANALQDGGGSGVGLYVCRKIMDQHNGKVDVISDGYPGLGSTFFWELPLAESESSIEPQLPHISTNKSKGSPRIASPRIFYIPRMIRNKYSDTRSTTNFTNSILDKTFADVSDKSILIKPHGPAPFLHPSIRANSTTVAVTMDDYPSERTRRGSSSARQKSYEDSVTDSAPRQPPFSPPKQITSSPSPLYRDQNSSLSSSSGYDGKESLRKLSSENSICQETCVQSYNYDKGSSDCKTLEREQTIENIPNFKRISSGHSSNYPILKNRFTPIPLSMPVAITSPAHGNKEEKILSGIVPASAGEHWDQSLESQSPTKRVIFTTRLTLRILRTVPCTLKRGYAYMSAQSTIGYDGLNGLSSRCGHLKSDVCYQPLPRDSVSSSTVFSGTMLSSTFPVSRYTNNAARARLGVNNRCSACTAAGNVHENRYSPSETKGILATQTNSPSVDNNSSPFLHGKGTDGEYSSNGGLVHSPPEITANQQNFSSNGNIVSTAARSSVNTNGFKLDVTENGNNESTLVRTESLESMPLPRHRRTEALRESFQIRTESLESDDNPESLGSQNSPHMFPRMHHSISGDFSLQEFGRQYSRSSDFRPREWKY